MPHPEGLPQCSAMPNRFLQGLPPLPESRCRTINPAIPEDAAAAVVDGAEIYIPLDELIDFEKEMERLSKEKENLERELSRVKGKLENESFVSRAPQKVVDEEKAKLVKYQQMYENVTERLGNIRKRFDV